MPRPRDRTPRLPSLSQAGARGWYRGGAFGAVYIVIALWSVWTSGLALGLIIAATVLFLIASATFVVLPPWLWGRPRATVYPALLAYAALVCIAFPLIGVSGVWLFIYVASAAVSVMATALEAAASIVVIGLAQFVILSTTGDLSGDGFAILLTVSISSMVFAISSTSRAYAQLREAQSEVARLAVAEERARFTRDLHDVLGHSLTVVTVKSELAGRLIDRDPARAKDELADIERLTRSALVDLRASIAGYREMNLDTELAAARAAFAAAEITATVPLSGSVVAAPMRELFAWAVRESVTNVLRHAHATSCVIELETDAVRIADDGVGTGARADAEGMGVDAAEAHSVSGMEPGRSAAGHGLAGLADRAAAAGARLTVAAREPTGTVVTVKAGIR